MITVSERQRVKAHIPIEVKVMGAEQLAFPDQSFDTVVATLVFCTIPDPDQAIKEIYRVLKPGGQLLVFEHVKMENHLLAKLQNGTPIWKHLCDGCHLNRDTFALIDNSHFQIKKQTSFYKGLFLSIQASKI